MKKQISFKLFILVSLSILINNLSFSQTYKIVDPGQTKCYNDSLVITCPSAGQAFFGQDAQYVTNPNNYTLGTDSKTVYDNNNSFSGVIEKYDPTNRTVYLTDVVNPTGATNLSFSGGTSHATGSVIFTEQPLVKRYSGKLLYIENSTYMVRSVDETKQFKFTLRF